MEYDSKLWHTIKSVQNCKNRALVFDFLYEHKENAYCARTIVKGIALNFIHVRGALEGDHGGMNIEYSLVSQNLVSRQLHSDGRIQYKITPLGITVAEFYTAYYEYREKNFLGSSLWHYWLELKMNERISNRNHMITNELTLVK